MLHTTKLITQPIAKFYSETEVRLYIDRLIKEFELCPKHCSIERVKKGACFSYHLKQCKGVCCEQESIRTYNKRVEKAILSVTGELQNEIIFLKGRKPREKGVVIIKDGVYKGFLFTTKRNITYDKCQDQLIEQKDNSDIKRILSYYKRNHTDFEAVSF